MLSAISWRSVSLSERSESNFRTSESRDVVVDRLRSQLQLDGAVAPGQLFGDLFVERLGTGVPFVVFYGGRQERGRRVGNNGRAFYGEPVATIVRSVELGGEHEVRRS
jgi:hypothetical protein